MNKKFTKLIAALALLVFMMPSMAGWGQTATYSLTPDQSSTGSSATSYITSLTEFTYNSISWKMNQWNPKTLQVKTNQSSAASEFRFYNTSAFSGRITQVVITFSPLDVSDASKLMFLGGTSEVTATTGGTAGTWNSTTQTLTWTPSSSDNYTYFAFYQNGKAASGTNYLASTDAIVVTYESGSTTYTVTYDGNGSDSGTVPVDDNEYEEGEEVTVLGPGTMAKTGHTFEWWEDAEGTPYEEDDTFEIYENTTLTAQWSVNTYDYTLSITGDDGEAMAELKVDGSTVAPDAKIAYNKEVTVIVATNDGYRYSIAVEDADHNAVSVANDKFTMPASNVTVTVTTAAIPTYTITFDAGTGTAVSPITGFEGSTITLLPTTPSAACVSRGWEFAGWATTSVSETTNAPTLLTSPYTINGDATLYAVYSVTEGNVFDNTTGGDFMIYAAVGNTNYYATTLDNKKIKSSDDIDEATTFEFIKKEGTGVYAIKMGSKYVSHNSSKTEIVLQDDEVTWTISSQTTGYGSWRITSSINDNRGLVFQDHTSEGSSITYTRLFGSYATSNVDGDDYFDVEIGGGMVTYATSPSCNELVATPTFTVTGTAIEGEENTYNGAISVAINCTTEDATIQYKLTENGEWQNYSQALSVSQSTTIWAKATKEGMDDSDVAEATYTIKYTLTLAENEDVLPLLFDGEENPIEIDDETRTATIEAGTEVRVSIDMIVNCKVFSGLSVTNVGEGGITEIEPNVYYSFPMPAQNSTLTVTTAETESQTLTVAGLEHINSGELHFGPESEIIYLMNLTNNEASICGQMNVSIHELTIATNYELQSVTLTTGNTTEEVHKVGGFYTFTMPTSAATLTFNTNRITTVVDELTRSFIGVTSSSYTDWSGKKSNSTAVYAGKTSGGDSNKTYIQLKSADSNSGIITTTSGGRVKEIAVTWNSSTSDGRTLDVYGKNTPYSDATDLYGNNNPNQGTSIGSIVKGTSTELTVDGDYTYIGLRSKSGAMYIDKIEITWDVNYSATTNVTAHTTNTGWYFIASPFSANNSLVATDGNNLPVALDDDATDLYYYDEPTHTWMNYKNDHASDFTFANGVGYLYANSQDVTLTFAGTSLVANDTKEVDLSYSDNAGTLAGWNLVGNPFDCNAILDMDCYILSGTAINTTAQTASSYTVGPCEGVMVKANEDGQIVTFTKATPGQTPQPNQLQMTVAQQVVTRNGASTGSATVEDNAIVSFNEGNRLEKFAFNADAAKLYIPQNDKEYAIVSAEAQGEMSVNFKAAENGTYTLSVDAENVEMNYLHLIDNMTGMDIDLLQTPSYTFEATTNDFESRFRLVFAAANNEDGASTGSAAFAFMSDGNWIINNASEATLQVIDLNGRILSSERVNGSVSKTINATPGVYMLRLINGENVMVQKIVVR